MWQQIQAFFSKLWEKITEASHWVLVGLVLIVAIVGAWVYSLTHQNKNQGTTQLPEISQVYEPSIGTPLPADTTEGTATTTEPSGQVQTANTNEAQPITEQVANAQTTTYVAPTSGLDPNAPIRYQSDGMNFSVTLPAHSQVIENYNQVKFFSASGDLMFLVNTTNEQTLAETKSQLQLSPDIANLTETTFANSTALKFSLAKESGIMINKNGLTYTLIGQDRYLNAVAF